MHLKPAVGEPQPVGAAIVDHLFPDGANGRIPIVGVTGSRGKTMVAQLVAHLMQLTGMKVGLACSKGAFFNQRLQTAGNCANWTSANRILLNRQVEAAVFENDSRTILNEGLAYDRCTVGVVCDRRTSGDTGFVSLCNGHAKWATTIQRTCFACESSADAALS